MYPNGTIRSIPREVDITTIPPTTSIPITTTRQNLYDEMNDIGVDVYNKETSSAPPISTPVAASSSQDIVKIVPEGIKSMEKDLTGEIFTRNSTI